MLTALVSPVSTRHQSVLIMVIDKTNDLFLDMSSFWREGLTTRRADGVVTPSALKFYMLSILSPTLMLEYSFAIAYGVELGLN